MTFNEKKDKKALKLMNEACKYRDNVYRIDYREWKKVVSKFERVARLLEEAGDDEFLEIVKAALTTYRKKLMDSPFFKSECPRTRAKIIEKS